MLITKLGQHPIIFGKLWIKKHGVVLDMRNDQLIFWPKHCQHFTTPQHIATKLYAKKPHAEKPYADVPRKTILKQPLNAWPKLLLYFFSSTQSVSKIPDAPKGAKL